MTTTTLPVLDQPLKGERYAAALAEICADLPPVQPDPKAKYKRILIPGVLGGEIQFSQLAFIAHGLRQRGVEVTMLSCDAFLPACTLQKVDHEELACTRWCHKNIGGFLEAANIPHRWYSDYLKPAEREACIAHANLVPAMDLPDFEYRGIPLGEHIDLSVESFFKVGKCDWLNPAMAAKARELLASGMMLTIIAERVLEDLRIDKVVMEDGKKTDWGVIREVARRNGIPVDVLTGAARGSSFLIEHDRWPAPSDVMPQWSKWRDVPLTPEQNAALDEYFPRRALRPYEDQEWTNTTAADDLTALRASLGLPIDAAGKIFSMYPNLGYDAGMSASHPAYETAAEWVADTIRFFAERPQHHLIVKIHPSESLRVAQDATARFLDREFSTLPGNIHILDPETPIAAQDVLAVSDVVMIYTSTVAAEAAYHGKAVINVGGGRHVNRGISSDVHSAKQYLALLAAVCDEQQELPADHELGRRYAYAVFFRSLLPNRWYQATFPNITAFNIRSLRDLAPGADLTMDIIAKGVLRDAPFDTNDGAPWWPDASA